MKRNFSLKRGFTLIEVLIVVAIIGILTAILVANYNDARKNSRDKIRKSDLKTLQLSLELYKAQNGQYPSQGCGTNGSQWAGPGPHSAGWGASCEQYINGLVPDYIPVLPEDPNQEDIDNTGMLYMTDASRQSYKVLVHMSVESNLVTTFSDEFSRWPSASCGQTSPQSNVYAVYSAGAECW